MNSVFGIITNIRSKKFHLVQGINLNKFNLSLNDDLTWDIGLDQSTSCFGICIQDIELNYQILLDIKIDKNYPRFEIYTQMFNFFRRTFHKKKIFLTILEKPVPSKYKNAGYILRELKGHVEEWCIQIPSLYKSKIDSIFPQVWKSVIVDKSKGKGRSKIKYEVASDIVDRFPTLQPYFNSYPFSDYDSFDACGILNGYKELSFTQDGIPKIFGTKEKRHTSFVCYRQVNIEKLKEEVKGVFGEFLPLYEPQFRAYNSRYSRFDNIRMASSTLHAVVTILPKEELEPLIWQYGVSIDNISCVLMYVFRKGEFTNNEIQLLHELFPWHEDIYDL